MSALATIRRRPVAPVPKALAPARVALLGTGTVGSAVIARLAHWRGTPLGARLQLVHVANSRTVFDPAAALARRPPAHVDRVPEDAGLALATAALGAGGVRIVIDATASEAVAQCHAAWLAEGIHVVTACKLAQGGSLARWREIRVARRIGDSDYGDSATVGAGLPLLRTLRDLRSGGDRIHAVAGVLSGSLAWLFNHYDGLRPFSGFVREARLAGYTEPDPREDLSGEDVRRKLLILARAAGVEIESDEVGVASLVPPGLAACRREDVDRSLPLLDGPLRERFVAACKAGERLRFIARLDCDLDGGRRSRAHIGLQALVADHPLAGGAGTDNRVAIWSDRYREQPLVIQGPGAGAEVTAAGLLDDVLRIASARSRAG